MAKAPINVTINGDYNDKDIKRAMRDLQSLMKDGGKTESTFSKLGKSAIGMGAAFGVGFAGVQTLTSVLSDSIAEGQEAIKVNAATAQIIKSTGGAAKVTADEVADLSQRLSEQIAVDDELIQQSANLILTFKNIRNEGEGVAAIFDRTVLAAQDLSAAGFGDVEGAAKMLGKALNDPVRGLTALGRAGVTFSAEQKELIKTLVEGGDVLGAQQVILGEVESQVGGVAAATATGIDKFNVYFANLKEELGLAILPFINAMIEGVLPAIKGVGAAVQNSSKFFADNKNAIIITTTALVALTAAMLANRIGGIAFAAQYVTHTVVMGAYTLASRIATAATITLTAAMKAIPFIAVVTGVTAVVLALSDMEYETGKSTKAADENAKAMRKQLEAGNNVSNNGRTWLKNSQAYTKGQEAQRDAISGTVSAAITYGNTLTSKVIPNTYDAADAADEAAYSYVKLWEAIINAENVQRWSEQMNQVSGTVSSAIATGVRVGSSPVWQQLAKGYGEVEKASKRAAGGAKAANDELDKLSDKKQARLDALKELAKAAKESFTEIRDSIYGTMSGWLNIGNAADAYAARQKAVTDTLAALEEARSKMTADSTDQQKAELQELADAHERAKAAAKSGAQSIVEEFVEQSKKFGEFGEKMRKLLAAGLNKTTFKQIFEMGAERGSDVADSYLNGNTAELIRQTNDTVAEYDKLSQAIANESAKAFYQAGLQSAIALLKAFSATLGKNGPARKELKALIKDLESELTINISTNVATPTGGTQSFAPASTGAGDLYTAPDLAAVAQAFPQFTPSASGGGNTIQIGGVFFTPFAEGGLVKGPTLGLVGEAGPELIVPLDRLGSMGGETNINLTVNAGMGTNGAEVGRQIVDALKQYNRRNGPIPVSVNG